MAPTTHQYLMPRFPNVLHLLFLLLSSTTTTLLRHAAAAVAPTGFSIRLIHRDSIHSPLYPGNLTALERYRLLRRYSKSHALWLEHTLLNTPLDVNIRPIIMKEQLQYMVGLSIGTPPVDQYLMLDTGSNLLWSQCHPCTTCFEEMDPLYYPSNSSTHALVPCDDPFCTSDMDCTEGQCIYVVNYADHTHTSGALSKETFTFEDRNDHPTTVEGIVFGCSVDSSENMLFGTSEMSGVLGMGRGPHSLVMQLGARRFSYCLVPGKKNGASYLRFGDDIPNPTGNIRRTPILSVEDVDHYYVNLLDLSVNGRPLNLPPGTFDPRPDGTGGTLIDTGATVTFLVRPVYDAVANAMDAYFHNFPAVSRLPNPEDPEDICYHVLEPFTAFPSMTFHLQGGDLVVSSDNLFVKFPQPSRTDLAFCMGFSPSNTFTTIGGMQQANYRFTYDLGIDELSFVGEECDLDGN